MRILELSLNGFRNYESFSCAFDPGVNLIVGENAQGKTNLLEAICYLSRGAAFRTRREAELIRFGAEFAELCATVESYGREQSLRAVMFAGRRPRQLWLSGVKKNSREELDGVLNTVLFCPEDLSVLKSGAYQKYMSRFGLDESKTPAALSNGMKIKYALALALSHGAELMLLDEPTSGLDPVSREELIEIFLSLKDEGKTILFSTHITSDLDKCADRILFLQKGRLTADSALNDFIGAYRLAAYTGSVPEAAAPCALGTCRTKDGCTALFKREDAERLAIDCRQPDLEEIMVHLEKEEAK